MKKRIGLILALSITACASGHPAPELATPAQAPAPAQDASPTVPTPAEPSEESLRPDLGVQEAEVQASASSAMTRAESLLRAIDRGALAPDARERLALAEQLLKDARAAQQERNALEADALARKAEQVLEDLADE